MCSISRFDRTATRASCSGYVLVILSLRTRAPSNGTGGGGTGSILCRWPVHSPHAVSNSPPNSDHIVGCFFVPPVSRALNTPSVSPRSTRHCCFSLPATLRTCIWDSFCSKVLRISVSPAPSPRMAQTLVLASCHAVFQVASDHLDHFGTWTKCCPHVPPTGGHQDRGVFLGVLLVRGSPHGT